MKASTSSPLCSLKKKKKTYATDATASAHFIAEGGYNESPKRPSGMDHETERELQLLQKEVERHRSRLETMQVEYENVTDKYVHQKLLLDKRKMDWKVRLSSLQEEIKNHRSSFEAMKTQYEKATDMLEQQKIILAKKESELQEQIEVNKKLVDMLDEERRRESTLQEQKEENNKLLEMLKEREESKLLVQKEEDKVFLEMLDEENTKESELQEQKEETSALREQKEENNKLVEMLIERKESKLPGQKEEDKSFIEMLDEENTKDRELQEQKEENKKNLEVLDEDKRNKDHLVVTSPSLESHKQSTLSTSCIPSTNVVTTEEEELDKKKKDSSVLKKKKSSGSLKMKKKDNMDKKDKKDKKDRKKRKWKANMSEKEKEKEKRKKRRQTSTEPKLCPTSQSSSPNVLIGTDSDNHPKFSASPGLSYSPIVLVGINPDKQLKISADTLSQMIHIQAFDIKFPPPLPSSEEVKSSVISEWVIPVGLPAGWTQKVTYRSFTTSLSGGKRKDVYYYTPEGKMLRSSIQVRKEMEYRIKMGMDSTGFDENKFRKKPLKKKIVQTALT